jgi:molecular chaperone GrpE
MQDENEFNPEEQQDQPPEAVATGLEERLAEAENELAAARDRLLRALADTENMRKRAQRDRDDAAKYAVQAFAKDMLDVADNLHRALGSAPPEEERDELMRNLLTGVAATEREMLAALERHGVKRIDPQGERFDHNYHQAMFEAENTGQPAGTIVQVLQPGYVIHDRLLRPAMVAVAKG